MADILKNGTQIAKQLSTGDIMTKKQLLKSIYDQLLKNKTPLICQTFLCDVHKTLFPCFFIPNESAKILSIQITTMLIIY